MRASYMSINRVDVRQAVNEVACFMAEPNEGAWIMIKRLVRYLVGHGRFRKYVKAPRVDTDSDYVGCVLTRKCTTCAHLFHGVNLIKAVKVASILLGANRMMTDFGKDVEQCVLDTDSSSAKSIMERRGAGRTRQPHCLVLWL